MLTCLTSALLSVTMITSFIKLEVYIMNMKLIVLLAFWIMSVISFVLQYVHYRSANNPIPENVKDVYDNDTYIKWQRYHGEKSRLEMLSLLVGVVVVSLLLIFDVHALVAGLFGNSFFANVFAVLIFTAIVEAIIKLPFDYVGVMKIEEKYGFNRTSKKTFVRDQIIGFVFGLIVNVLLVLGIYYTAMLGSLMPVILSIVLCIFVLIMNLLFPLISRAQNKFVPLEQGSLRDKLTALLTSHGYTVKEIEVMDASRRTTKSNAYFTGFGKQKKIVLFDNLISSMTEDEICAVFAHELGHGLNHDIPKLLGLNCINMVIMALLSYFTVSFEKIYTDFGFDGVNYGFTYVVMTLAFLPLLMQITSLLINAVSRRAEYLADAQAYKEGYADALISGLKKLSRDNFSHLSPSALIVTLEYSHPPLSERISALDKLKEAANSGATENE